MRPPIYLLRHGETEWNATGRIQGAKDSPLTERGRRQAQAMGLALRQALAGAAPPLYCSPLGRAQQTLEILCETARLDSTTARFDERLGELSWGAWDGMTRTEIEAAYPGALAARLAAHWTYRPPQGDSYADLSARLQPFLDDVAREGGIVVSHGAAGRVLRGLHLKLSPQEIVALAEPQDVVFRLDAGGSMALRAG